LKNLEIKGFINQFDSDLISKIFEESWVLVNTAVREGLPNSFLEALAHQCAILSSVNPENVTERFGYLVTDNNFQTGLNKLFEANDWIEKGQAGKKYVLENYELNKAIAEHIRIYSELFMKEKLS
jgi:glycosyltransferase involved in cell wall biosynthesis